MVNLGEIADSIARHYDAGKVVGGLTLREAVLDALHIAQVAGQEREQDIRELRYMLEVERGKRLHLQGAIGEALKHTGKVCREEWTREQVDNYLREQMAITPPLPDKRILSGG